MSAGDENVLGHVRVSGAHISDEYVRGYIRVHVSDEYVRGHIRVPISDEYVRRHIRVPLSDEFICFLFPFCTIGFFFSFDGFPIIFKKKSTDENTKNSEASKTFFPF